MKPFGHPLKNSPLTNGVHGNAWELLGVLGVLLVMLWGVLPMWHASRLKLDLPQNFRLAYDSRDDYLLYRAVAENVCQNHQAVILGDSVIWGMYVNNDHTLPARLNKLLGNDAIGNLAVDGLHPVAMESLVKHYGQGIRDRTVYLHLNPLWLTSPLYDLSGDGDLNINHPRLLPQFDRSLKCYHQPVNERCRAVLEQSFDFYALLHHLRTAFFENTDFKSQLVKHPENNLFNKIKTQLSPMETGHANNSKIDWYNAGITEQDWPWVSLDASRQWESFLNTIGLLQKQGNAIVVLLGNVNPHMQTLNSLSTGRALLGECAKILQQKNIKTITCPDLPSEEYGDASHPLAAGYERWAQQLAGEFK